MTQSTNQNNQMGGAANGQNTGAPAAGPDLLEIADYNSLQDLQGEYELDANGNKVRKRPRFKIPESPYISLDAALDPSKYGHLNEKQRWTNDLVQTFFSPILLLSPRTASPGRILQLGAYGIGALGLALGGPLNPLFWAGLGATALINNHVSSKQTLKYEQEKLNKDAVKFIGENDSVLDEVNKLQKAVQGHDLKNALVNDFNKALHYATDLSKEILDLKHAERSGVAGPANAGAGFSVANGAAKNAVDTQKRAEILARIHQMEDQLSVLNDVLVYNGWDSNKTLLGKRQTPEAKAYAQLRETVAQMKDLVGMDPEVDQSKAREQLRDSLNASGENIYGLKKIYQRHAAKDAEEIASKLQRVIKDTREKQSHFQASASGPGNTNLAKFEQRLTEAHNNVAIIATENGSDKFTPDLQYMEGYKTEKEVREEAKQYRKSGGVFGNPTSPAATA